MFFLKAFHNLNPLICKCRYVSVRSLHIFTHYILSGDNCKFTMLLNITDRSIKIYESGLSWVPSSLKYEVWLKYHVFLDLIISFRRSHYHAIVKYLTSRNYVQLILNCSIVLFSFLKVDIPQLYYFSESLIYLLIINVQTLVVLQGH